MTSRKYVICVASLLYVFMILNLVLWHFAVKEIFTQGDLNRLGGFASTEPLMEKVKYSKRHTPLGEYIRSGKKESFDVITLGDSFSEGIGATLPINGTGYQDYLVNKYGIRVLNAGITENCVEDLYILLNSGIIDEVRPKAIILESAAREVQHRLGMQEIQPESITKEMSERYLRGLRANASSLSLASGFMPSIMVQANMKFISYKLYHIMNPECLSFSVYINELSRNLFSNPGYEHILVNFIGDFNYLGLPLDAETANMNLNKAAKILREKNIQPIFFAAADKYDLYYPYIINHNGRPENNFFPEIRKVSPKDYVFIDTMKMFREALERGEQDIYCFNDTHWSSKGIQIFCDELVKYFDWLN